MKHRKPRPNPFAEKMHLIKSAQVCLVQAAAATTEPFTGKNLAMATVLAGTALLRLTQASDEHQQAEAKAIVESFRTPRE